MKQIVLLSNQSNIRTKRPTSLPKELHIQVKKKRKKTANETKTKRTKHR